MTNITFTYDKQGSEVEVEVRSRGKTIGFFIIDEQHRERNVYGSFTGGKQINRITRTRGEFEEWVKPLALRSLVQLGEDPNHKHDWELGNHTVDAVSANGDYKEYSLVFRCQCLTLRTVTATFDLNTGKDW